MIAEKILGNLSESTPSVEIDTVELDWFEAEKKRIRKTTAGGRDIGIAIDEQLKDGEAHKLSPYKDKRSHYAGNGQALL